MELDLLIVVLIVILVRGSALGVSGLFLAEALAMLGSVLIAVWLTSPGWRWRMDRAIADRQLRFGFPLYLNTLLAYTANRINTVFIGSMSTTAAVSFFTVANRVPDQLSFVLRAYVFVYLPNMSRLLAGPDEGQSRRLLASSLRLMSFCFAFLALDLSLFRHELLGILAPEPYQVAAPAVPLLLGGLAFASLGMIMANTFVALGDSRTPVRIHVWTSLLGFALNWFFIRSWGFMGAAWANFLFNVVGYAITDAVLSRRIRPAGRDYLGILAFLAALVLVGMRIEWAWLRLLVIAAGAAGSLGLSSLVVVSGDVRSDVLQGVGALRNQNIFVIHGAADNAVSVSSARQMVEKLKTMNANVTYVEIPEGGHGSGWNDDLVANLLAWIKQNEE